MRQSSNKIASRGYVPQLQGDARPARSSGFSLIEMMLVVTIIGILGALATPNVIELMRGYQAQEASQDVALNVRLARAYSQKRNEPIRISLVGNTFYIEEPTYTSGLDVGGLTRAISPGGWSAFRVLPMRNIDLTGFPMNGIVFCPSGEARYRENDIEGTAVCPFGDLASTSADVEMVTFGRRYRLLVRAALGTVKLQPGGSV